MFDRLFSIFKKPALQGEQNFGRNTRLVESGWWAQKPQWYNHTKAFTDEVTIGEYKTIVSAARRLFWNFPIVTWACEQKSTLVVGKAWTPYFTGQDADWGAAAEEFLQGWMNVAYVNGRDWATGLYQESLDIDVVGEMATAYVVSESGFPMLQQLPWHAIGSRDQGVLTTGPYIGLQEIQGIVLNKQGRPVAVHFLGADAATDFWISMRDMDITAEPRDSTQVRGLPAFTSAIVRLRAAVQLGDDVMAASALASKIGLLVSNPMGAADISDSAFNLNASAPVAGLTMQEMSGGTIRYIQSGGAEEIKQMVSEIPSEAQGRLERQLLRHSLLGAGMPPDYYMEPSESGGAASRIVLEQVNRTVNDRQQLLSVNARKRIVWVLSRAMELGLVPKPSSGNPPGDWTRWGFTHPPELTADSGYQNGDTREALKLGMTTYTRILGKEGLQFKAHVREKIREEQFIRDELTKAGLPSDAFRILTPNGNPTPAPEPIPQESPAQKKKAAK